METTLIFNGETDRSIVLPAFPGAAEKTAAEELQAYLNKAYGALLPIRSETDGSERGFFVGHTKYAKRAGLLGKSEENWIIAMSGGNLVLTGGISAEDRGTLYAVYHFLEDVVGVRWWTRFEEDVPELERLALASDFRREGTPAFSFRKILSHKAIPDFFYEARTRGNVVMPDDQVPDGVFNDSIRRLGGALHMGRPNHVHTLGLYFPADPYFDLHPEWFAWSEPEQKRVPYAHYCLTNEEYIDAISEKLLGFIAEDRQTSARTGVRPPVFYSVSFPDASGSLCQCEKCRAAIEKSGASGYAIRFVNHVARRVAEQYPDVKIETLIYSIYLDPPKDGTLPEKNMILRLAQVYVDIIHGLHHPGNAWYLSLLRDWSAICKRAGSDLYIWEYMYQLFFDIPAPVANRLGDTFRSFREYGVKGIFVESQCYTADMWELNVYLLHHLCEDPCADTEALIDDFMDRFYGAAGKYVKEYYRELVRASEENPYSVFCIIESAHFNYLDVRAFRRGMALLDQAIAAAADDPVRLPRVQYLHTLLVSELVIKFYDLKRRAEELGESFAFDRRALCQAAIRGFTEAQKRPKARPDLDDRHAQMIRYFKTLDMEEDVAPLPEGLPPAEAKDVYRFFFKNTCRHLFLNWIYGFSVVRDKDSATGKVAKFSKEQLKTVLEFLMLCPTSRYVPGARGVQIQIEQDSRPVCTQELFLEDIVPDAYHLYRIGSVSGIRASADTRVNLFGYNFEWVSLTGISTLFPMDACDVYVSMKFTGELYGGDKRFEQALYLDQVIVIRKS